MTYRKRTQQIQAWIRKLTLPCSRCPYKLGLIKTLVNPCPQCKMNGYQIFERFRSLAGKRSER